MQHTVHNEARLLRDAAAGSHKAFSQLYQAYQPLVQLTATRFVKLTPLAEEVCNDVFTSLWQNRSTMASIESLQAYLLTATRNRSLNALKQASRSQTALKEIKQQFEPRTLTAEAHLLDKEYLQFIREQIARLPDRAREVFTLCREEGYSYDDVSSLLGISRNAVKGHMVYSMKKLRATLEKDLGITISCLLIFLFS
jgi:RNA polymerase sigma-70 factor (ECF subfamily)